MINTSNILALICLVVAVVFSIFGKYDVATFILGLAIFNRIGGAQE